MRIHVHRIMIGSRRVLAAAASLVGIIVGLIAIYAEFFEPENPMGKLEETRIEELKDDGVEEGVAQLDAERSNAIKDGRVQNQGTSDKPLNKEEAKTELEKAEPRPLNVCDTESNRVLHATALTRGRYQKEGENVAAQQLTRDLGMPVVKVEAIFDALSNQHYIRVWNPPFEDKLYSIELQGIRYLSEKGCI